MIKSQGMKWTWFAFVLLLFSFIFPPSVRAADIITCDVDYQAKTYADDLAQPADLHPGDVVTILVKGDTSNWENIAEVYGMVLVQSWDPFNYTTTGYNTQYVSGVGYTASFRAEDVRQGTFQAVLRGRKRSDFNQIDLCRVDALEVGDVDGVIAPPSCTSFSVTPSTISEQNKDNITITYNSAEIHDTREYYLQFYSDKFLGGGQTESKTSDDFQANQGIKTLNFSISEINRDNMQARLMRRNPPDSSPLLEPFCIVELKYDSDTGQIPVPSPGQDSEANSPFSLCQQAGDPLDPESKKNIEMCNTCFHNDGIWTAVGCIPFNSSVGMIRVFITIGLGIAGGVVVLMVLAGSFLLSTSQGDLKRVDEAKGLIGSAVIGLVFIIFSVTILRFIGVDILQIPGLGGI